jgi:hypothetical protein
MDNWVRSVFSGNDSKARTVGCDHRDQISNIHSKRARAEGYQTILLEWLIDSDHLDQEMTTGAFLYGTEWRRYNTWLRKSLGDTCRGSWFQRIFLAEDAQSNCCRPDVGKDPIGWNCLTKTGLRECHNQMRKLWNRKGGRALFPPFCVKRARLSVTMPFPQLQDCKRPYLGLTIC